jgi:hypothetical protein
MRALRGKCWGWDNWMRLDSVGCSWIVLDTVEEVGMVGVVLMVFGYSQRLHLYAA